MKRKDACTQLMQEQLDEWAMEIDRLKNTSGSLDGRSRVENLRTIDQLRVQQEIVRYKLSELQKADDEAWRELKPGVDTAWRKLGGAIRSAAAH